MQKPSSGYREIEHTADWELEAWAPDLPGLLEAAGRGMYALASTRLEAGPRQTVEFSLPTADPEHLLVSFLSELLYYSELENLAFDRFELHIEGDLLHARLEGAPLASQEKEIKAVTYHNLNIRPGPHGLQARVILDV